MGLLKTPDSSNQMGRTAATTPVQPGGSRKSESPRAIRDSIFEPRVRMPRRWNANYKVEIYIKKAYW